MISAEAWNEWLDEATDFHAGFKTWTELQKYVVHAARLEDIAKRMVERVAMVHAVSQLTSRGVLVDILASGHGEDLDGDLVKPPTFDDFGFMLHGHPQYMGCRVGNKLHAVGRRDASAYQFSLNLPEGKKIVEGTDENWQFIYSDTLRFSWDHGERVLGFTDPDNEPKYCIFTQGAGDGEEFEELTESELLELISPGLNLVDELFPVDPWLSSIDLVNDLDGTIAIRRFTGNYVDTGAGGPQIPVNEISYQYDSNLAAITEDFWALEKLDEAEGELVDLMREQWEQDDLLF